MSDEAVTLACRACGRSNRVPVDKALRDLAGPRCGSCQTTLLRVHGEPLVGLDPRALAHPWDTEALEKLKAIPYADELLSKVFAATLDKVSRFYLLANAVRVTERQAPTLYRLYLEAAGRLDVDPPPLFIVQSPALNAFATGASEPLVAVTSGLLDAMEEREIVGILGHELTHVKLAHVLYRTLAVLLANGMLGLLGRFGLAKLLATPLQVALARWSQMSELSADRGELLATGSVETAVRAHMILSGGTSRFLAELDVGAFIDQAAEAEALRDSDLLVYVLDMMDTTRRSHPLPAWRVHHQVRWARTPAFFELLAGTWTPALEAPAA